MPLPASRSMPAHRSGRACAWSASPPPAFCVPRRAEVLRACRAGARLHPRDQSNTTLRQAGNPPPRIEMTLQQFEAALDDEGESRNQHRAADEFGLVLPAEARVDEAAQPATQDKFTQRRRGDD